MTTSAAPESVVTAAGLEVYYYADRCGEHCACCRRITRSAIKGGPAFCTAHVQKVVHLHLDAEARRNAVTAK